MCEVPYDFQGGADFEKLTCEFCLLKLTRSKISYMVTVEINE